MEEKIAQFRLLNHRFTNVLMRIDEREEKGGTLHINFDHKMGVDEQKKFMRFELKTIVKDESDLISIEVTVVAIFEYDADISEKHKEIFFNHSAPAIVFPFIRAFISTMSSLSGTPILLPTLNFC